MWQAVAFLWCYLIIGFVTVMVMARDGFFNYYAKDDQIEPGVLKYLLLFTWPVVWIYGFFLGLWNGTSWLNKKFNNLINAPVDKR